MNDEKKVTMGDVEMILISGGELTVESAVKFKAYCDRIAKTPNYECLVLEIPKDANVQFGTMKDIITKIIEKTPSNRYVRRGTKLNPFEEDEVVRLKRNYTLVVEPGYLPEGMEGVVVGVDSTSSLLYAVDFEGRTIKGMPSRYLEGVQDELNE